jgi:hypothetical protein
MRRKRVYVTSAKGVSVAGWMTPTRPAAQPGRLVHVIIAVWKS